MDCPANIQPWFCITYRQDLLLAASDCRNFCSPLFLVLLIVAPAPSPLPGTVHFQKTLALACSRLFVECTEEHLLPYPWGILKLQLPKNNVSAPRRVPPEGNKRNNLLLRAPIVFTFNPLVLSHRAPTYLALPPTDYRAKASPERQSARSLPSRRE